ncbi:MAG: glycosyltransferase, partial [Acidimicrobiales bacterium]
MVLPSPAPSAPPVVAVVVASDPGPWLEEALAALGAQDYPELSVLFLDAGSTVDPVARVAEVLPGALTRRLGEGPGFAAAANEALHMVQGASYLLFCHDDVALDPDAVRVLVEEALRSNAGVVGPKLVEWDRPERLLDVGLAVDKTAFAVPLVERSELDQEQHDAVRDVFAVPAACVLVRSDLFGAVGGFDAAMDERVAAVDLCWRAQVAGARVLVVPSARARHVLARDERVAGPTTAVPTTAVPAAAVAAGPTAADGRSTASDRAARSAEVGRLTRDRLRAVLKNYGWFHLLRVLPQVALVSLADAVVAAARGRIGEAGAYLRAWPAVLR